MKTYVLIEVSHRKPLPVLAEMIAGRAYTIDGVSDARVVKQDSISPEQMRSDGFSLSEISLGAQEVVRS